MKIEQSELKDLMTVVTLTLEPADYQEEVAKQLTVRVWYLPVWLRKCTARVSWLTC